MSKVDILDEAANHYEKTVDDIVKGQPISNDYFEFKYSTGKEIGRTFPQVDCIFFTPEINSIYDLNKFPTQEDFSGRAILKKSAKLTDFISSWQSGLGIMISAKCFKLLRQYNLGQYKFYDIMCDFKDIDNDYVFLALDNPLMEYIDFSRSVFYTSNLFDEYMSDITFSSKSEMLNYREGIEKDKYNKEGFKEGLVENDVQLKKIFIKPDFQDLDLITWGATHYFSKHLVDALVANNISGMQFKVTRRLFKQ